MSTVDLQNGDDRDPRATYPQVPAPRRQSSVAGIPSVLEYFDRTVLVSASCYDDGANWPFSD